MNLKAFFIIFKGLSLEQIKQFFMFFMEGESPTLRRAGMHMPNTELCDQK